MTSTLLTALFVTIIHMLVVLFSVSITQEENENGNKKSSHRSVSFDSLYRWCLWKCIRLSHCHKSSKNWFGAKNSCNNKSNTNNNSNRKKSNKICNLIENIYRKKKTYIQIDNQTNVSTMCYYALDHVSNKITTRNKKPTKFLFLLLNCWAHKFSGQIHS